MSCSGDVLMCRVAGVFFMWRVAGVYNLCVV